MYPRINTWVIWELVPVAIKQLLGNRREPKAGLQSECQPSHVLNCGGTAEDLKGARDASRGAEDLRGSAEPVRLFSTVDV